MISNSRYATNYLSLLFAVIVLISLIPDGTIPLWMNALIGLALGLAARKALLARLDAQSERERVGK